MFFFVRSSCILSFNVLCGLPVGHFFPSPSVLASQTCLVSLSSSILFRCPNDLSWDCSILFYSGWVPKVILIIWFHILSLLAFPMTLLKCFISAVCKFCFCFSVCIFACDLVNNTMSSAYTNSDIRRLEL
jgi:hypothetical protein